MLMNVLVPFFEILNIVFSYVQGILSHIGCVCTETARQSDWDGIVACHQGFVLTTTWNYRKGSMGTHRLEPEHFGKNRALNVHATVCLCECMRGSMFNIKYNLVS